MDLFKKLKEKLGKGNTKQLIGHLAAIVIVCIIFLISYSVFFPKEESSEADNNVVEQVSVENKIPETAYSDSMEDRLEKILNKIDGVGEVEVMITYETSTEVVPASNVTKSEQTTEENDKQGGTRVIKQENTTQNIVTVSSKDYNNSPMVIKEIKPMIRGVIVVAQGAEDPMIKNELIEAVTTIFQIKSHKVKVYGRN
ncbi:stage III sporulation protein AG [Wukongibacter baidiensis]|uniref:stage III sporulation protein AG n=1 Tax=Wukongibacter baidiensis TaxID=1723361 RepID=UPI003D7FDEFC